MAAVNGAGYACGAGAANILTGQIRNAVYVGACPTSTSAQRHEAYQVM